MDKFGEKPKKSNALGTAHINKIPSEIVGRFLLKLSVCDRKECEGVSPRWNRVLSKSGWIEQVKLNREIFFEGRSEEEIARYWENPRWNLFVSVIGSVYQNLIELDLHSFGVEIPIAESIRHFSKLERLNIQGYNLQEDFVDHLPGALCDLKTSKGISVECLQTLSRRCPNLEEVPFLHLRQTGKKIDTWIELVGKFPRQKRLLFPDFHFPDSELTSEKPAGFYSSIGKLSQQLSAAVGEKENKPSAAAGE